MILALLILQATTADPGLLLAGITFDLRKPPPPSASPGDIVVTGRRRDNRLGPLPDLPADPILPRVETGVLGNARLGVIVDQTRMPDGTPSNRAMVTLKIPL